MFEKNMGMIDRGLRILIGIALVYYAVAFQDTGYNAFGWVGIIPIATGLLGRCPMYSLIGVKTG